jgi:Family of unknown function (DUF5362)
MNNPYSPPAAPAAPGIVYPAPPYGASVGDGAIEMLRLTRPWVMLISIMCFIAVGLLLLAAAAVGLVGLMPSTAAKGGPFPMALLGLFYVPFAAIYIYPGVKLWKFSAAISTLLGTRSAADLENALRQQKSFWKYSGIAAIAMIVLYFVIFVGAVVVGIAGAAGAH